MLASHSKFSVHRHIVWLRTCFVAAFTVALHFYLHNTLTLYKSDNGRLTMTRAPHNQQFITIYKGLTILGIEANEWGGWRAYGTAPISGHLGPRINESHLQYRCKCAFSAPSVPITRGGCAYIEDVTMCRAKSERCECRCVERESSRDAEREAQGKREAQEDVIWQKRCFTNIFTFF